MGEKKTKTVKEGDTPWTCSSCGTAEERLRYKSGKMANCYTCQAYTNARINSAQKARKQAGICREVSFTLPEFLAWAEHNPRLCRYCGIDDASYHALGYTTANGRRLEALGLDRLTDDDYTLTNIEWCCYQCNRTKNNSLTVEDMELLGPVLRYTWRTHLGMTDAEDLAAMLKDLMRICAERGLDPAALMALTAR